jgi:RNA polymerase sigma-54 factor
MALRQKLELRQGQSLVMTPQLQQAIKLLQMSNLEVDAFVDSEIERNPLLERDEGGGELRGETPTGEGGETAVASDDTSARADETHELERPEPHDGAASAEPAADSGWSSLRTAGPRSEGFNFDAVLTREPTLAEHVTNQLNLAVATPAERLIGAHLIGLLDEAGYLTGDLESAAEMLGISCVEVERVLAVLQGFDPTGVFARTLRECLALQLTERDRLDPAMAVLIDNLELVAKRDWPRLRQICGVDMDDLKEMLAELRKLDPKPGHAFGAVVSQPVVPDVLVRPALDGTWSIELNSDTLPRILVNNRYYSVVVRTAKQEDDRVFLSECYASANWLIKSLDQRARTILSVAQEIVRQQDGFLVHGVQALRPLTLRTVADAIGVHESTVSRVTANKYMATPRGTFELRYFFTAAIAAAEGGEAHSAEAVRQLIKELIGAETAETVLSDDMIVDRLRAAAGIDIARRTVAKYRESLGLASSVGRRRDKRLGP